MIDTTVSRLAEQQMRAAQVLDQAAAAKMLAPSRHPERWCLCRNACCLGWSTYLSEAVAVYGHAPTEQEMADDAKIRMAVKALRAEGGAR